jgi:hypothetical protein
VTTAIRAKLSTILKRLFTRSSQPNFQLSP